MLVAVVVLFFISWAPFHIQRLGYVYFKHSFTFRTINEYLFYFSGCLYFLSSTLNPVLYNLMSAKYKKAFHFTLCKLSTSLQEENTIGVPQHSVMTNGHKLNKPRFRTQLTESTLADMRSLGGSFELQERIGGNSRNQRKLVRQDRLRSSSLDVEYFIKPRQSGDTTVPMYNCEDEKQVAKKDVEETSFTDDLYI